jgi:hypothetical protein
LVKRLARVRVPAARKGRWRSSQASAIRLLDGYERGKPMTSQAASEQYMAMARRWFTEGWAGNIVLADDLFTETVRTNGVLVGVAGPKRRIQERLAGFPDLITRIEDMFSSDDKS